jgi:hypothetical protein
MADAMTSTKTRERMREERARVAWFKIPPDTNFGAKNESIESYSDTADRALENPYTLHPPDRQCFENFFKVNCGCGQQQFIVPFRI